MFSARSIRWLLIWAALAGLNAVVWYRVVAEGGPVPWYAWTLWIAVPAVAILALFDRPRAARVRDPACYRCGAAMHATHAPGDAALRMTCFSCGSELRLSHLRDSEGARAPPAEPS
jgi:hypothetical protein